MSDLTIVDTDVLIDAALRVRAAIDCLDQVGRQSSPGISVVTEMELIVGCRSKTELRKVEHFLRQFRVLSLDEQTCDTAVELLRKYRLSHGLLIPDALIAATAITLGHSLVSKNQRDYRFIEGLQLLPYPDPFALHAG